MTLPRLLDQVTDAALAQPTIAGSVVIVMHKGEEIYRRAAGDFDREVGIPMREDAIFRLASFTKPLVAATTLAMIERGLLTLDMPVTAALPYFAPKLPDGSVPVITVKHLLTHTAGIGAGGKAFDAAGVAGGLGNTDLSLDENLRRLAMCDLLHAPGLGWIYGKGLDVLGGVVAAVHGGQLQDALYHYVTGPLEMKDTSFPVADPARLALVYADNPGAAPMLMPDPHFVAARTGPGGVSFSPGRAFNPKAFQSGGSGAHGSALDFIRFLEALRRGGGPILSPESVSAGTQNQIGSVVREPGSGFGFFGAVVTDSAAAVTPQPAGSYEWGGIWGHRWFVDPHNGISAVMMTNTANEGCSGAYPYALRDAIYRGLAGA